DSQHVHHRVPLRRPRLHDRDGGGGRPARGPAGPRRAGRYADHRCGLLRAARQRRLPAAPARGRRPDAGPRLRRVAPRSDAGLRDQDREPGRHRALEVRRRGRAVRGPQGERGRRSGRVGQPGAGAAGRRARVSVDTELETGCGIVPYSYKEKAAVAALQWAVGLELFLLARDPWRVVLSTDHPNGGSFLSYPRLIRLLMDRAYRDEQLKQVNQRMLAGSALLDGLAREYTLAEIAVVTRAGPARLLGLKHKGHLGAGADADVTIYADDPDRAQMFATPRYVIKGGAVVVEEGQLRRAPAGRRLAVRPEYDAAVTRDVQRFFDDYACVAFANYGAEPVA